MVNVTYQLHIKLTEGVRLQIGRLGEFDLPAGNYVYTGSARKNFKARVARHLRKDKKLRWHIDYLLVHPAAKIVDVVEHQQPECRVNQSVQGSTIIRGFGASDCRSGCASHLQRISTIG